MENIFFPKMKKGTFFSLASGELGLEEYLPLNRVDQEMANCLRTKKSIQELSAERIVVGLQNKRAGHFWSICTIVLQSV